MALVEFRIQRGTAARWAEVNPVLGMSEFGHEKDTGKVKIGDGKTKWTALPYLNAEAGEVPLELQEHIDSLNPHPNYDSGASLLLLYENAKV